MITLVARQPTDLLAVRFATSPVWETVQAVQTWAHRSAGRGQTAWLEAVGGAAAGLDLAPLVAVLPRRGWVPDFLTPAPRSPAPRLRAQLAEVRATPVEQVARELARCRESLTDAAGHAQLDALLADPAHGRDVLADRIEAVWHALVRPYWPRIRALLSADVAHRARLLAEHGLGRVLAELDRRVSACGATIRVEAPEERTVPLDERGVVLMPSAFVWPAVVAIADEPWQPTIVYPARGIAALWDDPRRTPDALGRLLGGTRAAVLVALDEPASTTALAARLSLSPSGASRHLTALRDAGLVATARHRHEVLYRRTRLGAGLVREAGA